MDKSQWGEGKVRTENRAIYQKKKKKEKRFASVVHTSYNESKTPDCCLGLKTQPLKISVYAGGRRARYPKKANHSECVSLLQANTSSRLDFYIYEVLLMSAVDAMTKEVHEQGWPLGKTACLLTGSFSTSGPVA